MKKMEVKQRTYKVFVLRKYNASFLCTMAILLLSTQNSLCFEEDEKDLFEIIGMRASAMKVNGRGDEQLTITCDVNGHYEWCKFKHNGKVDFNLISCGLRSI